MAIGPEKILQDIKASADEMEEHIDRCLPKSSNEAGRVFVGLDKCNVRLNSAVQDEIRRRYLMAGWASVEFHSDQREGSWVELK